MAAPPQEKPPSGRARFARPDAGLERQVQIVGLVDEGADFGRAGRRRRHVRAIAIRAGRATHVPQAAATSGIQRSATVTSRRPFRWASPSDLGWGRRPKLPGMQGSRLGSFLPCPAGRSVPGRGGPQRQRRPRPDGTGPGPCWVRGALGPQGHERSPAVTSGEENPQLGRPPAQAARTMPAGEPDCGPDGREGSSASPVVRTGTDEFPRPTGLY
jgi:hypothetical protein